MIFSRQISIHACLLQPILHIRSNVGFDRPKLILRQWQFVPSFQSIFRQVICGGRIASLKNSVYTDLANPLDNQAGFVLPHPG